MSIIDASRVKAPLTVGEPMLSAAEQAYLKRGALTTIGILVAVFGCAVLYGEVIAPMLFR